MATRIQMHWRLLALTALAAASTSCAIDPARDTEYEIRTVPAGGVQPNVKGGWEYERIEDFPKGVAIKDVMGLNNWHGKIAGTPRPPPVGAGGRFGSAVCAAHTLALSHLWISLSAQAAAQVGAP